MIDEKKAKMSRKVTLANQLVQHGLYYNIKFFENRNGRIARFIKVSATGYNFLDIRTGKCVFKRNFYKNEKLSASIGQGNSFFITYAKHPLGCEFFNLTEEEQESIEFNFESDINLINEYNTINKDMKVEINTANSLEGFKTVQEISSFIELKKKIGAFEILFDRSPIITLETRQFELGDKTSAKDFFDDENDTFGFVKNKYIANSDNSLRIFKKPEVQKMRILFT